MPAELEDMEEKERLEMLDSEKAAALDDKEKEIREER